MVAAALVEGGEAGADLRLGFRGGGHVVAARLGVLPGGGQLGCLEDLFDEGRVHGLIFIGADASSLQGKVAEFHGFCSFTCGASSIYYLIRGCKGSSTGQDTHSGDDLFRKMSLFTRCILYINALY